MAKDSRNINFYLDSPKRLAHYDEWAKAHGFITPAGRPNRSALVRYALDKITGFKPLAKKPAK